MRTDFRDQIFNEDKAFSDLTSRSWICDPAAPVLADMRNEISLRESVWLISGSTRIATTGSRALRSICQSRAILVYHDEYQNSLELARQLRALGYNAASLCDEHEHSQLSAALTTSDKSLWPVNSALQLIQKRPDLGVDGIHSSRWITRSRPKIDRVACPWLIRRFIDRSATFQYVPHNLVVEISEHSAATPFDVDGVVLSPTLERCTFDRMLEEFKIQDPALFKLAQIIRGADTGNFSLDKNSHGLLAISLGLSRLHATDDAAMVEACMSIYDGLYFGVRTSGLFSAAGLSLKAL